MRRRKYLRAKNEICFRQTEDSENILSMKIKSTILILEMQKVSTAFLASFSTAQLNKYCCCNKKLNAKAKNFKFYNF